MSPRLRGMLRNGFGDAKTCAFGIFLIVLAVLLKAVFLRYTANIEPILAVSLVAGSVLGRWWTVLVPMVSLGVLEPILWGGPYSVYTGSVILGLTFFIVTGFLFVGVFGRFMKPRVVFRVGSMALLTLVSIPLTIAYDVWTDVGEYYFIAGPMGLTFWNVLELQVPFTLVHLLSSLIFVPLIGMGTLWLSHVAWPATVEEPVPEPSEDR